MTKFTKTQTELLARLALKGRVDVGRYNGLGADGGVVRGGNRETDAALKLEAMGLLVRTSYDSHRITKNGYSILTSDIGFVAPKLEG
jgi:hypothetical protein